MDSLKRLEGAVRRWRERKKYPTERLPEALLKRARAAASVHGISEVVQVTGLRRSQIEGKTRSRRVKSLRPAFTRFQVAKPETTTTTNPTVTPIFEAEVPSGMKLRLFQLTPEGIALMSSMAAQAGGGR